MGQSWVVYFLFFWSHFNDYWFKEFFYLYKIQFAFPALHSYCSDVYIFYYRFYSVKKTRLSLKQYCDRILKIKLFYYSLLDNSHSGYSNLPQILWYSFKAISYLHGLYLFYRAAGVLHFRFWRIFFFWRFKVLLA